MDRAAATARAAGAVRWLRARPVLSGLLVVAALVALYLWRCLLGQRALAPIGIVWALPPWSAIPHAAVDQNNHLLVDPVTQFLPWLELARSYIHDGHLPPQWSLHALGGTPFFPGNAQLAALYPLNLPIWVLPFGYALGVAAALKLVVAGAGAFLLARELRLSFWPSLLAGTSYAFAPFMIVWLSHPHVNVYAFLPVVLWLVERLLRSGRLGVAPWLALAVAVALVGGHPGSELQLALAATVYALVRGLALPETAWSERLRRLVAVGAAGLVGALVAAIALVPSAALVPDSRGQTVRGSGGGGSLPHESVATLLFPDWWGRPQGIELPGGPVNYNERTLYVGVVVLLLAIVAVLARDRWREKAPFALLAAIGVGSPLGIPVLHEAALLPVLRNANQLRLIGLFDVAAIMLAAFGAQRLLDVESAWRRLWIALAALGVAVVVALARVGPGLHAIRTTLHHFRTGREFPELPVTITLTAIGWAVLLGVLVAVVALLRRRTGAVLAVALLVGVSAVDLAHFRRGYQPQVDASLVPLPETPMLAFLRREQGSERITAIGPPFTSDTGAPFRLQDVRGYDPPEPSQRFTDVYGPANVPVLDWFPLFNAAPPALRLMDLLSVRYVAGMPGIPSPLPATYRPVYAGADGQVWRAPSPQPRAFVPERVRAVSDPPTTLAAIYAPTFRPGRDALVDPAGARAPTAGAGMVRVTRDEPDVVELGATLTRGGLVALSDPWHDGWHVDVDGRSATPLVVDGILRGVNVPAGTHTVRWWYRSPGLRLGLALSLLGLVLLVAAVAVLTVVRRRARRTAVSDRPS